MGLRQRYYHIKFFEEKLDKLTKYKQDFEVESTTYTKKIITKNEVLFFNGEGDGDKLSLLLINSVRNDAKKWLETHSVNDSFFDKDIDFFNLLDIIKSDEVIVKVDIKGAYWEAALKKGIVTQETNEKFLKWYENTDPHYAKQARLKALGSLATTKYKNYYRKGRITHNDPPSPQPTRPLYMEICSEIDRLMKDCNFYVSGCKYYYWDCIFVAKENQEEAVEYIKSRGYDISSIVETKLEFVTVGGTDWVISMSDNISYVTKRENKDLLMFDRDM